MLHAWCSRIAKIPLLMLRNAAEAAACACIAKKLANLNHKVSSRCRKAIRETGMPASAELADKPQLALREAVRESDLLLHCKGAFIVGSTGNDGQDALRKLVVELFQASTAPKLHELQRHQVEMQRQYGTF